MRDAKRRKIAVLKLRFYDTRKNFKESDVCKIIGKKGSSWILPIIYRNYVRLVDDYFSLKNSFEEFLRDLICILFFAKTRFILFKTCDTRYVSALWKKDHVRIAPLGKSLIFFLSLSFKIFILQKISKIYKIYSYKTCCRKYL